MFDKNTIKIIVCFESIVKEMFECFDITEEWCGLCEKMNKQRTILTVDWRNSEKERHCIWSHKARLLSNAGW